MAPTARLTAFAAAALLATAACGGAGRDGPSTEGPPPSATATVASSADTAVHGSWRLDLTAEQLRATLARTGYGAQAEQFLRVEEVEDGVEQVLTVEGSRFAFAYQYPDGTWQVGWEGAAEVVGDVLRLSEGGSFDPEAGADVLRWDVSGDELRLEVVSANDVVIKGLPNDLFLQAYLTTAPFVRTDCAPTEATCA